MLQIDHVYEFFNLIFKDIDIHFFNQGVIEDHRYHIFNSNNSNHKILFYDQEPILPHLSELYIKAFQCVTYGSEFPETVLYKLKNGRLVPLGPQKSILSVSEKSKLLDDLSRNYNMPCLYYFYHGFAALDWYRGFYALNYTNNLDKPYTHDFITFNRLLADDRSYRLYFISLLQEKRLLDQGLISFNVASDVDLDWRDELQNIHTKLTPAARDHIQKHLTIDKLIIDNSQIAGYASADIPRLVHNPFWHIVTETVFYYPKLHLTEKIFKPIVMKQPFMLLAAPGNLAYLRNYGFKTFDGIIDEGYDNIHNDDDRTNAVVRQIAWYCALTAEEKRSVIEAIAPIVEYNFHHFYGEFKHIITRELLDNCRTLFKEIGYNDANIDYKSIYHVLTN